MMSFYIRRRIFRKGSQLLLIMYAVNWLYNFYNRDDLDENICLKDQFMYFGICM